MEKTSKPVLTVSQIRAADCLREYYFKHVALLRSVVKREALVDGSIHHLGQEQGEEAMLEQIDHLIPVESQEDQDRKSIKTAMHLGMLRGSLKVFDIPEDTFNEVEWLLPLYNPDTGRHSKIFMIGGKADKVNLERGILYEYKTTGETPSGSKVLSLPLDRQLNNAVSGIQRWTGRRIDEISYRWVRKPSIKQRQGETVQQFCDRLLADYEERPDFYFLEETLLVGQEQVREWERDLWDMAHILHYCYKNDHWPRNSSRCAEWGGCDFLPICRGEFCDGLYEKVSPNQELRKEAQVGYVTEGED